MFKELSGTDVLVAINRVEDGDNSRLRAVNETDIEITVIEPSELIRTLKELANSIEDV